MYPLLFSRYKHPTDKCVQCTENILYGKKRTERLIKTDTSPAENSFTGRSELAPAGETVLHPILVANRPAKMTLRLFEGNYPAYQANADPIRKVAANATIA